MLKLALLTLLLAGCASSPSAPQQDRLPVPTVTYLSTGGSAGGGSDGSFWQREIAYFELRNETRFTFEYRGPAPGRPDGTMHVWRDGRWSVLPLATGPTDYGHQAIVPGESLEFMLPGFTGRCRYELRMRNVEAARDVVVISAPFDAPDMLGDG